MTTDILQALRDANPVPTVTDYPAATQREQIDAIVIADDATVTSPRVPRRRWVVAAVAATAVAALAVGVATLAGHDDEPTSPAGGAPVTCSVRTDGGRAATAARLATARSVIGARAGALGSDRQSFELDPGRGTVVFRAHGIGADTAGAACHPTTSALRPLVLAPARIDRTAPTTGDPLRDLGFAVPRDPTQVAALSAAQRARLTRALSHTACQGLTIASGDAPAVRCDDARTSAYLLGVPLAADRSVVRAEAVAPSAAAGGSYQWTVAVTFDRAAQRRIAAFTAAHSSPQPAGGPATCAATTTPCSDFVAVEVDGRVLQAPVTTEPIVASPLQISGAFTEASARDVAAALGAAAIELRLG